MKFLIVLAFVALAAADGTTLAPILNYDVTIDVPVQNSGLVLNGTLSLQAQGRLVDLPVVLTPGQKFNSQIAVSAFAPAEVVQIRWFSFAAQPLPLLINNFVISSSRGVRTFCGHSIPQSLEHNVFVDFGLAFCSH